MSRSPRPPDGHNRLRISDFGMRIDNELKRQQLNAFKPAVRNPKLLRRSVRANEHPG